MRAKLCSNTTIHGINGDWLRAGEIYAAEFSTKMISPRPVVLFHPEEPDINCEVPFGFVEIVTDATQ